MGATVRCAMEQRPLGRSGVSVSALGFGCGAVGGLMVEGDPAAQREAVALALDAGVSYFDTAALYGNGRSENHLGRVLRELDAWSRVVVGTKARLGAADLSDPAAALRRSLTDSLARLGRDHVDIFHLHTHIGHDSDGAEGLPAEAVLTGVAEGMDSLVRDGLIRVPGFTALGSTADLHRVTASGRFGSAQVYLNAANPSAAVAGAAAGTQDFAGLVGVAERHGVGVLAIRVFAGGALSGAAERAVNASPAPAPLGTGGSFAADVARAAELVQLAQAHGLEGALELSVRLGLAVAGVSSVLVGLSNSDHLRSALRWAERGPLSAALVDAVTALAQT